MKNPLSFRILYLVTRLSYWGSLILVIIVIIAGIVMLTLDPQKMRIGFPGHITLENEVIYLGSSDNIPIPVKFNSDSIQVPVKYLSNSTVALLLLIWTVILTGIVFITRSFNQFIRNVINGKTFHNSSITYLKRAALGLVALELLDVIYEFFGQFIIRSNFDLGDIKNTFNLSFPSTPIILALALWVLAHIFTKGKELEDEQKLIV